MRIRRRKSRSDQVLDALTTYLKFQAISKAAKGASKTAKGASKTAAKGAKGAVAYQAAKRTPLVKRIPLVAGAGVAALVAFKAFKGGGGNESAPAQA
jgi:hypothetical protein